MRHRPPGRTSPFVSRSFFSAVTRGGNFIDPANPCAGVR